MQSAPCVRLKKVHLIPGWKLQSDSSVTPNPPKSFTMVQSGVPYSPDAALVSITGVAGKYTGGMASKSLPLPISPLTGQPSTNARVRIRFFFDNAAPVQALEFGGKITDANGLTYNANFQLDQSKSSSATALEVAAAGGGWSPVFAAIPRLAAGVWHEAICQYAWSAGAVLVSSITVDGLTSLVPTNLKVPGEALGWGKSAISASIQPDNNTTGGTYNLAIDKYDIDCW